MSEDREARAKRVIGLVRDGHTFSEVAELVGVSRSSVAGIIYRHRNPDAVRLRRPQYGTGAVFRAMAQAESEA